MKVLLENYRNKKGEILKRLKEFEGNKDYFYELCFCILTPQSSAKKAWSCILKLKEMDFQNKSINPEKYINGVRFHVNKSKYIERNKKIAISKTIEGISCKECERLRVQGSVSFLKKYWS